MQLCNTLTGQSLHRTNGLRVRTLAFSMYRKPPTKRDETMSFFTPRTRRASRSSSPRLICQPRLEVLEDRCLLAVGDLDPTFGTGGL